MKNDAFIIGAGPSGLATAIGLAQGGWKVGIVERLALPRPKICGGFIGPENKTILERLGVLESIRAIANPITQLSLHADADHYISSPIIVDDEPQMGFGISRAAFDHILLERARQLGIMVFDQCSFTVEDKENSKILSLKMPTSSETVGTRYLIEATGAGKEVNARAGLGAGALYEHCRCPDHDVSLYFLHGAHLGVNRFEDGLVNACYVVDHWLFERLHKNMPEVFEHFLQHFPSLKEQFAHARRLGPFKGIGVSRPARARFSRDGRFLVGDAVDVLNPVVGGGNSMALASGMLLAETLLRSSGQEISFKQLEHDYRQQWNRSFATRIKASWVLGHLSHQPYWTRNTIRLFKWHRAWLENIFQFNHRPLEFQP